MSHAPGVTERVAELIAPLRDEPRASAVLCDIDGTLAPIIDDPEASAVPEAGRTVLRELARRYSLVACITGRQATEARRIVGVDELVYFGNHGLELLSPGATEPSFDPAVAEKARRAREFVADLDADELSDAGLRLENKGPIQGLHWRGAPDEVVATRTAERIAAAAEATGLAPNWGRKVLEIRPVESVDKGTAVVRLVAEHAVERAAFGGDDRGDLDAFAALRALAGAGRLTAAVCIGVLSEEAPPELSKESDVVVDGPPGFLEVLKLLAEPARGRSAG